MRSQLLFVLLVLGLSTDAFSRATITQRLEEAINEMSASGGEIRALVVLKEQADIQSLNLSLYTERASIQERAFTIITALQSTAERTQTGLLAFIESRSGSSISSHEPFWIINMIRVTGTAEVILEIAERAEVDMMDLDAKLERDKPVGSGPAPLTIPNGTEPGLRAINAPELWALGFTGAGRIVMNIDTGVNGNHPAINYKWRGTHVPASQAWFDPVNGTSFPNDCDGHGTHTIGTMTGLDPATNDTIGVAPEAEWIASNSLCSGGAHTSNSIAAFQWAMDPDGDPQTIDDMPDAIGNSWFDPSASDCGAGVYRPVFDAVEAAGIAIVFSAGNNGPGPSTITVPKNTNTNLVNVFAIGAVDGNNPNYPIASFSSRGPSTCGGDGSLLIKPEVSAPGVSVRSSFGSGYAFLDGTSMACPHVVGAIALLKQAFPQFTGHEIKMALYNTARDLGAVGEDNNYGTGIIDVYAAFLSLGAPNAPGDFTAYSDYLTPNEIALTWSDPTNLVNGDTLLAGTYTLFLSRDGEVIDSLEGGIQNYSDGGLVEGEEYLYEMWTRIDNSGLESAVASVVWTAGGSARPASPSGFSVTGSFSQITLEWTNPTANSDGTPMIDFAGINLYQDGVLAATFTRAAGDTGSVDGATYSPAVAGPYTWYLTAIDDDQNESDPTATLLTPLALPLADHFGQEGVPNPAVWATANADVNERANAPPSSPFSLNLNGTPIGADTVTMQPVDLSAMQGTGIVFAYYYQPQGNGDSPENGDSLSVAFRNDLGDWITVMAYPGSTLQAFQSEAIDIESAPANGGTFFHSQFQVRFRSEGSVSTTPRDDWFVDNVYLGIAAPSIAATPDPLVCDTTVVGGSSTTTLDIHNVGLMNLDVSSITSTLPGNFSAEPTSFTVAPGEAMSVEVTFSPDQVGDFSAFLQIVSNDPTTDTLSVAVSGVGEMTTSSSVEEGLPREFSVSPNFPNPFNPTTTIKYDLPASAPVELVVYSLLGGKVRTLISREMEAGYHQVDWDGKNDSGVPVTSGVYLYRFTAGDYLMIRKMILLK
jgi:subtilisin family serine protease